MSEWEHWGWSPHMQEIKRKPNPAQEAETERLIAQGRAIMVADARRQSDPWYVSGPLGPDPTKVHKRQPGWWDRVWWAIRSWLLR